MYNHWLDKTTLNNIGESISEKCKYIEFYFSNLALLAQSTLPWEVQLASMHTTVVNPSVGVPNLYLGLSGNLIQDRVYMNYFFFLFYSFKLTAKFTITRKTWSTRISTKKCWLQITNGFYYHYITNLLLYKDFIITLSTYLQWHSLPWFIINMQIWYF